MRKSIGFLKQAVENLEFEDKIKLENAFYFLQSVKCIILKKIYRYH